jgi:hypothetical protein
MSLRAGGFGLLMVRAQVDELVYNEKHNEVMPEATWTDEHAPPVSSSGCPTAYRSRPARSCSRRCSR